MKKAAVVKTIIIVVAILVVAVGAYFFWTDYKVVTCTDYECFEKNAVECSRATFINDEQKASWRYTIEGIEDQDCEIEVELLIAKEGELGLNALEGETMSCFYPFGTAQYPGKDLSYCHGRLKEDLQEVIIRNLHQYIVSNLGEIKEELSQP